MSLFLLLPSGQQLLHMQINSVQIQVKVQHSKSIISKKYKKKFFFKVLCTMTTFSAVVGDILSIHFILTFHYIYCNLWW